jgi:uncharacterized protein (TIGR00297 family)
LTLAPLSDFDLGAVCAIVIAFAAWRAHALTAGGAVAAVFVGTATAGGLGLGGAAVLLAFFVPSVALSRWKRARKKIVLVDVAKTGARDANQVLANGGVAAVCALLAHFVDHRYALAFAGAFAAATADTWGTEIGALAARPPRSIVSGKPIAAGLSGGISLNGTLAEVAGAAFIAGVAFAFEIRPAIAIVLAGIGGAFADSVLGATVQALRFCGQCQRATESEPHHCGANTQLIRGFAWFGNDTVNLAATLCGACLGLLLA